MDGGPLKLVERSSATTHPEYATLSYCWGKSQTLLTTKATLSTFSHKIPEELLPKTFLDAIHIALALEIPYI
ncbi:hypothetical protein IMZ48_18815 [Candidatus Bathyarchaeota archaeon]|nr:hypothetical protein [Candidatus Bathyarchaeota archaeon]